MKINISISLMSDAYRLVLDIARNGQLKEEHKERFEKITLELLKIVKDKKEIMEECTGCAEIFFNEEDMEVSTIVNELWQLGEEAKQSREVSVIRIILTLHFYMELKGKENGRE